MVAFVPGPGPHETKLTRRSFVPNVEIFSRENTRVKATLSHGCFWLVPRAADDRQRKIQREVHELNKREDPLTARSSAVNISPFKFYCKILDELSMYLLFQF